MQQKSFVIYENWAEIIKRLPTEDAGEMIQAICNFKTDSEYEVNNPYIKAIFEGQIKPQLDKDLEKYQEKCKRMEAINRKRKGKSCNDNDNDNNKTVQNRNDIDSVTDTDTETDTDTDTDNYKYKSQKRLKQTQATKFTNFEEREYDFSKLEKKFARN